MKCDYNLHLCLPWKHYICSEKGWNHISCSRLDAAESLKAFLSRTICIVTRTTSTKPWSYFFFSIYLLKWVPWIASVCGVWFPCFLPSSHDTQLHKWEAHTSGASRETFPRRRKSLKTINCGLKRSSDEFQIRIKGPSSTWKLVMFSDNAFATFVLFQIEMVDPSGRQKEVSVT